MNEHIPDRGPRDPEDDPYYREEREEPTHEEREEWIQERLDAARDSLHEKLVADELVNIVIPDLVMTRKQAD